MSMFREHYVGGLIAYTSFFGVSFGASLIGHYALQQSIDWNPTISFDLRKVGACFVIAVLSGLWPDVDIKSKSQKICYRIFIILNLILIFKGDLRESALLGLFAMLPLIGKHRGWTHSKLTMLLLPGIFLLLPIYFQPDAFDRSDLLSTNNVNLIKSGLPFYTASLIGYATHLHLDGILLRSRKAQRRKARSS
ncbi:metal-dependent hydrolase [Candidatus Poribacteria bacterium]|nr:metal-dependent hydrolase [Candidatus Poribacteria bacterium]